MEVVKEKVINELELQFEFGIRENYECYIHNLYDGNLDDKESNLNRLIEYSKEFTRFIESNYNIKNISQINLKHFKDFIDLKKIENGVEQATKIGISLLRVESIINYNYHTKLYFSYNLHNNFTEKIEALDKSYIFNLKTFLNDEYFNIFKFLYYCELEIKYIDCLDDLNIIVRENTIYIYIKDSIYRIFEVDNITKKHLKNLVDGTLKSRKCKDTIRSYFTRILKENKMDRKNFFKRLLITRINERYEQWKKVRIN